MRLAIILLIAAMATSGARAQVLERGNGPEPRVEVTPDRVLERGNGPEPSTLDAHKCPEVACGNILRDLYEGLVGEDAAGRTIPGLATSWNVAADGRTWTFRLREDARWSNGERLDAAQVVASFRRAFAPATAAPFAAQFDALSNARQVQAGTRSPETLGVAAPDARTVVFTLTRSADLPELLRLPIAYPVYLPGLARHGAQHTRPGNLVGNGAYRLRDWRPQANLTLERNPHFRERAPIAAVRFQVTEDAASELQRFAAGDLHVTETVPPQPLPSLRDRFGAQLRIGPYLGTMWLGLNVTRPPLGVPGATNDACRRGRVDPCARALHLRQALSLALDRDILTRHVTGLGETPAFAIVPPGIAGYVPAAPRVATRSQREREALARTLYAGAGYSAAHPVELELRYNTSTPLRRLTLAAAAMWREVLGAHVTLRNEEWKVYVGNRQRRVITQVFRGGWIADVSDARNFLANFGSDSLTNWSGVADPAFDSAIDAADAAPDLAARARFLRRAEERLLARQVVIPIYHYSSKHLVRPEVRGFVANPLDHHPSRFLSLEPRR
ncbi:MAG: peptide ABC transporter substrate-binding protein [Arenimonas sp.]